MLRISLPYLASLNLRSAVSSHTKAVISWMCQLRAFSLTISISQSQEQVCWQRFTNKDQTEILEKYESAACERWLVKLETVIRSTAPSLTQGKIWLQVQMCSLLLE